MATLEAKENCHWHTIDKTAREILISKRVSKGVELFRDYLKGQGVPQESLLKVVEGDHDGGIIRYRPPAMEGQPPNRLIRVFQKRATDDMFMAEVPNIQAASLNIPYAEMEADINSVV